MTPKTKTRKAPARKAAAPKAAPKEANGEPKREITEIQALFWRWKWLEVDQEYQATIADTEKESERLVAIHNAAQAKIERKLATLIPENFSEVRCLLRFVVSQLEQKMLGDDNEIAMLRMPGPG